MKKNLSLIVILSVALISIGYTILRYHIVGNTAWSQFPVYILNKGLSLTGFILLAINFSLVLSQVWCFAKAEVILIANEANIIQHSRSYG